MPAMLRRIAPCLLLATMLMAEERQPEGMDVIGAVQAVKKTIAPEAPASARGKPWENELAALTSPDPRRHNPAVAALIRRGPAVLPDLAVLAEDKDWQVRMRVVRVASYIGGEAGAILVLARSRDAALKVREEAAMGLGLVKGPEAFPRLAELIAAPEPDLRCAAARGLGTLGDVRGFDALLALNRETDDLARREMREALANLALRSTAVPALAERITRLRGVDAGLLVEVSGQVGDPRLCPALAALVTVGDVEVAQRAVRALAANGDSRALPALCRVADGDPTSALARTAVDTLRRLTGYDAAPGPAWRLWWQQHQAEVERLMPRDAYIADLHDVARVPSAAELARFPVADLEPLLEGALGSGPPWWPALAFKALAADEARRWTPHLASRIKAAPVASLRLPLILILDQLDDPAALAVFKELLAQEGTRRPIGAERVAIDVAVERRRGR
jgi:HEAT repeat protein